MVCRDICGQMLAPTSKIRPLYVFVCVCVCVCVDLYIMCLLEVAKQPSTLQ